MMMGMSSLALLSTLAWSVQQDDTILERGEKLLEEAKAAYEMARTQGSVAAFVEAGFKLEEARIKFIVVQEIGSPERQKIAGDRMRAVNQLNKLINDGRVALSSGPAMKPEEKGVPPPPEAASSPAASPVTPRAAVDVTRRRPVPDVAPQKEAEKLIRELFKDQYAKKSTADRKTLCALLLEQASKTMDDTAALWVLYRECQEIAIQVCDLKSLVEAVEESARFFDVDRLALRHGALTAAGKNARGPDDCGALAAALLSHTVDLVAADQCDSADKAASSALQHARKSGDASLTAKAVARVKEIGEIKTHYQSFKNVLQVLARNPDDAQGNLEMGKFLCFVKGNWDLGPRFLVKGSDAVLKELAGRELALSLAPADRAAVADGWWNLAEKEKSELRKNQLLAHCRGLYESSLVDASGLLRTKIEKRLDTLETGPEGRDLLKLIDPQRDSVHGAFALEGRALLTPPLRMDFTRLEVPYAFPEEYDLRIRAVASEGTVRLALGLPLADRQCLVFLGGDDGRVAALEMIDTMGWTHKANPTRTTMTPMKSMAILCSVRKAGLTVSVDGKKLIEWKEFSRLSLWKGFGVSNTSTLILCPTATRFQIDQIQLVTVSGQGKRLR